ncbi:PhzF family phenazine biosynthesis protein [Terriglobus saanensis]|uniref:Phenazine biosynthesis protein PhzF family n=1 Tax=Terriglobus saanensis (strain ATCC BAA-1853 / DSM 23119 / SP1PR4) TaxID=401053 RepID=E8V157_TERSS|nr:PhzF family phenazine biosynthesis protein [Terriglobus saanensis]ADV83405.1 phenazine biosynthesis protein PhzF family [Terriglobus saanensis SP1PR4]
MSNPIPQRELAWSQVDVFAEAAYEGNMLAIFHDGTGLSTAQMQSLARETNLSETTFILPQDAEAEAREGVQVRIFTTQEELPFAGHPTLGTASWLCWNHPVLRGSSKIRMRLKGGVIDVQFKPSSDGERGIYGEMQQFDPVFSETHSHAAVAKALGLLPEDLDASLEPQTVSTGLSFCIVALRDPSVLSRLSIPPDKSTQYLATTGARFFYCVARSESESETWHARMQFYNGEDPATGSAAGCAVSYLVHHSVAPSGTPIVLKQGLEMLRPSRIIASATRTEDGVGKVFIGGRTIHVAKGRFFLP